MRHRRHRRSIQPARSQSRLLRQNRIAPHSQAGPVPRERRRGGKRFATRPRHCCQHGRVQHVAHRIGDREMQGVSFDAEIERVSADIACWLEPSGRRGLAPLAGVRGGQESMLELCLQRKRRRTLDPVEQVSEAAVGDAMSARAWARADTTASAGWSGSASSPSSDTPTASPRLVTGAETRNPSASCTIWTSCSAAHDHAVEPASATTLSAFATSVIVSVDAARA